ncbi:MAG TPA: hypothetical protein VFF65_09855 [Phycisphaerales bacterium]|nr:hypothetical protein [Phycisphaerales bacterium]
MASDTRIANGPSGSLIEFWRPLIWSAIVGGTVTALGIQLIFTLLGVGIGAALANPNTVDDPASALGGGAIAWLFISGIVSFAAGGFVAGCMSGVIRTGGGALHGIVSWALAAVFGATIATLAGATTMGGAAAGAGAMGGMSAQYAGAPFAVVPRGIDAPASPGTSGAATSPAAGAALRPMLVDRYGRELTEAEARALADQASSAVAKAALWTAAAFIASMVASAIGGTLGRRGHVRFIPAMKSSQGSWGTPATA